MIEIEGQSLANVVSFKDVKVSFNKSKITFIRGTNLDADPAQPTGNGAGKSLLMSCPSNVFFFTPPLSIKKKDKKQLLGKNSAITLRLKGADGNRYEVEQRANKYKVTRNGEDMQLRTVPIAEKFIREELFPMTELMYYTTAYVSTQRSFKMQESSDADRLSYLTEIFSLGDYDNIKRYFLDRIGEVKESELKLQLLERDLLEVNTKLKKLKRNNEGKKVNTDELKAKRTKLERQIERLVDTEFNAKALVKELGTLLNVEKELDALRSSYTSKKPPNEYVKYLKEQRKLTRAYDSYEELMTAYRRTVKDTQKKIDELTLPKASLNDLESKLEKYEKALETLTAKLSDMKSKRRSYDRLVEERDELLDSLKAEGYDAKKKKPDLDVDHSEAIAGCRTTLKLKSLLEHAHDEGDDAKCPTCMSEVDFDNVRASIKDAEKRLPKLVAARAAQVAYKEYVKAAQAVKDSAFDPAEMESIQKRIEDAGPVIDKTKKQIKTWEKHETLTRALKSVKKPTEPDERPATKMTLDELDDNIELCEDIAKHLSARDRLIENNDKLTGMRTVKAVSANIEAAEAELAECRGRLDKLRSELTGVVKLLDEADSAQHEHGVYITQKKKLVERIDKIKPMIEDKRILEVLVKAYSSKGVKTNVANEICALLEQNLNAYSSLIFNEPFVFTVSVDSGGMSMMVDRGNDHVSDVRSLSGAESNAFRMLFVLSLLPLLPSEKRINMLTLDEPCAHMDSVSRSKFLHVFLPVLSEVVPHIFVITPNLDDYCEGSTAWTVVKEKGKSRVLIDDVIEGSGHNLAELMKTAKKLRKKRGKAPTKKRKKAA